LHAVHRGSTTYPATTRSAPLGLDAHSKTSNTVLQRALGGVPGPAALMLHYVPICCTGLQRVALQCNVPGSAAPGLGCRCAYPSSPAASINRRFSGWRSRLQPRPVAPRESAQLCHRTFPDSLDSVRLVMYTHCTAPHRRAGTTPCAVGWCGGPRRLRVSGEPRVTCRVACCHVACCMLAPRTLHSRAE
jgi:hypothetical protein